MSAYSGDGAGTVGDPYVITTYSQLCEMMTCDNRLTSYWKLGNDIDASASVSLDSGAGWTPVGVAPALGVPFTGGFDGDNHTITGLFINRPAGDPVNSTIGFFGTVDSTAIQNLGLVNINITGLIYTGGLCGVNCNIINNCYTNGIVTSPTYAGGFCGLNSKIGSSGIITNCYSSCSVTGTDYIGGFCGRNYLAGEIITNCYSVGVVSGSTNTGGFCGVNDDTITSCYYDSETSGQSDTGKGTPKTTAQMKQQATFTGWDFATIWYVNEDVDYPVLIEDSKILIISSTTGGDVTTPGEGYFLYNEDEEVTVMATADYNNFFAGWTGTAVSSSAIGNSNLILTTVKMTGNYTLIANFSTFLTRISFPYFSGKTLTYSIGLPDGTLVGSADQSLPESGLDGYYTTTVAIAGGNVCVVKDTNTGKVVGGGVQKTDITTSADLGTLIVGQNRVVNVYSEPVKPVTGVLKL